MWVGRRLHGIDKFNMTNELMQMNLNGSDGRVIGHKMKKKENHSNNNFHTPTSEHRVDEIFSDLI